MLRQLYPILLSITIALAIGVTMHPGEARIWIRQASQWGVHLLDDTVRATSALADEVRATASQGGYASTTSGTQTSSPYPPAVQNPNWTYTSNGGVPPATSGVPAAPATYPNGYYRQSAAPAEWPATNTQSASSNPNVFPRVLANGTSSEPASYPNQFASPYPVTNTSPATSAGYPYATAEQNPLRPSMEREAPWTSNSSNSVAAPATSPSSQVVPNMNAGQPRVQWAGEQRAYQGMQEPGQPTNQIPTGYLPSPSVASTTEAANRYFPPQTTAQQARASAQPPQQSGYSLPPVQSVSPSGPAHSPAAYPSAVPPASAYPAGQASSSPHSIRPVQARPFAALKESPSPSQQPQNSYVASVPQQSHVPQQPYRPQPPAGAEIESPDPVADLTLCEGAQILARVGSELVLGSEVLPIANETLAGVEGIEKASKSDVAKAREQLVKQILPQHIELKLLYVDAKRNLPPEAIENIKQQLGKRFEEVVVSERLKKLELGSRRELEEKLKEWGTSLEHEKHAFIEKSIAQQWVFETLRKEEEVTYDQLLDYYHAHATEYDHPTRVRWEHLEVSFDKHPDKREAWQLIAMMGNAVQQGQSFAKVAQERSEGPMASSGGQRDWLTQGSLKSDVLDQNLFALPVAAMSPILEDETGFHIVRVVEREDAYRTPFEEIQSEIRDKIKNDRKEEKLQEFVAKLREEIPITTIFDTQTADSGAREPNGGHRF